jgi:small subunit ribosomal protein S20
MATHKSASKAHRRSNVNKARNTSILSKIKSFIKRVEEFISAGKSAEAIEALRGAESELMRGVSKGTVNKNAASRKVSRLTKKVKAITKK